MTNRERFVVFVVFGVGAFVALVNARSGRRGLSAAVDRGRIHGTAGFSASSQSTSSAKSAVSRAVSPASRAARKSWTTARVASAGEGVAPAELAVRLGGVTYMALSSLPGRGPSGFPLMGSILSGRVRTVDYAGGNAGGDHGDG
ncbi:hypothetical protein SPW_7167 [Streptomyces sp. W007]|nr:hypothetical protein SPW_7167 [Streptomyces sp. W007]